MKLLIGILSPNNELWSKVIMMTAFVFILLIYDIQSAVNSKSVPVWLLAFAFENFYLNFNIGLYLMLWILFAVNNKANFNEHISEQNIWELIYEFLNYKAIENKIQRIGKICVITILIILFPYVTIFFLLTSLIVYNKGERCNKIKLLLILTELVFLCFMIPLLIIKFQELIIQKESYDTPQKQEDYYIDFVMTILSVIIRWFLAILKISHSYYWEGLSKNWSWDLPKCAQPIDIEISNNSYLFGETELPDWDCWLICCQKYQEIKNIWVLNWDHSFWLKWVQEWVSINPVCPLWKQQWERLTIHNWTEFQCNSNTSDVGLNLPNSQFVSNDS